MAITTLSSRANQDIGRAKKAAKAGPAIIMDRVRPAHVLLTFDEYKRITGGHVKIADLLTMPGLEDIELEIPVMHDLAQPADLA